MRLRLAFRLVSVAAACVALVGILPAIASGAAGPGVPVVAEPAAAVGFDAIRRTRPEWPGDPTGALGTDWLLAAVNDSYAVYDRSGIAAIGPNPLASMFALPPRIEISDARIVYDQYRERFVLVFLGVDRVARTSVLYLVSIPDASATDPGTWCGARVVSDRTAGDGKQYADDLGLGYDEQRVVVTEDTYDFAGRAFAGSTVLSFPKGGLYDCSRTLRFATFSGAETRNPSGSLASAMQPASTVGSGTAMYLTSFDPGRPDFVVLWRISDGNRGPTLRSVALRVPAVRAAERGTQGGADIGRRDSWWDPGDLRLASTFADLDLGSVFTAHVVSVDLGPDVGTAYREAAIRWYEIQPGNGLANARIARTGTIGTPQTDAGWPSLATDTSGDLFVTYSRASAVTNEFLSAWIAEIPPGTSTEQTMLLESGTARFEAVRGRERWGQLTATSRDPVDGRSIASVDQVALGDGSGPTDVWQQTIHFVSDAP